MPTWAECYSVSWDDYEAGSEGAAYYEQGLIDGEAYVFDEWDADN